MLRVGGSDDRRPWGVLAGRFRRPIDPQGGRDGRIRSCASEKRIVAAHAGPRMTGVDAQVREEQRDELAPQGRAAFRV